VALRPRFAAAWNNLGVIWAGVGDWNRAAAAFGQAVEATPDSADAHTNLARTLEALGQRDAAMQEYQKALAINSHHEAARRGLQRLQPSTSQPATDR
jgi:tetratricopeptide (TPR) repeat protein